MPRICDWNGMELLENWARRKCNPDFLLRCKVALGYFDCETLKRLIRVFGQILLKRSYRNMTFLTTFFFITAMR